MKFIFINLVIIVLGLFPCLYCEKRQCGNRVKLLDGFVQEQRGAVKNKQVIRPKLQHSRSKRSLDHTREENGLHAVDLVLTYNHNDKNVIIDLRLNDHLIPEGHFISHQTESGGKLVKNLTKTEIDLCHYHGIVRGTNNSRVALSTCRGINGIVFDEELVYHIQSGPDMKINSEHFLYKRGNTNFRGRCGNADWPRTNLFSDINDMHANLRFKRAASSESTLRVPYNSNEDSLYLELVVVVDNDFYNNLNADLNKVHAYVKDLVNIASSFYVPLNIFFALVGVVVWTKQNDIQISSDSDVTLENFYKYRNETLAIQHPNDHAHFLTAKRFDCDVVGIAYESLMCTTSHSGGVTVVHSQLIGEVATTMAHEIGHNFGLAHDDSRYCKCRDAGCLMHFSTSSVAPKHWSSCSLDQFNLAFHRGVNHCLKNIPTKLFGSNTCGNRFVEFDEQCDCGSPKDCTNPCCNPNTCMLAANASCATGQCCNLLTCQPKMAGHECRKAKGECDLSEYCNGNSENCPNDFFKRDTESCGHGDAYCYKGLCKSHLDQCKLLWGISGQPAYQCFASNIQGSSYGSCGFNYQTKMYTPCRTEDVYCGLLHCRALTNQTQYGVQTTVHKLEMRPKDSVVQCVSVIIDLGVQSKDPGLSPNGAKCGENKMCIDQKCESIEMLRARGIGLACPDNCNGNGICNNLGHCHCFLGFAPPTCLDFGISGSIDSGPFLNFNETSRLSIVFIMSLLLVIVITTFGLIYWRKHRSIPTPSELGRKISTAPKEMIEIIRRASIAPRELARRVSVAPREIARRLSNAYTNATSIQTARSKLRRVDNSHNLSNSRELILNVDEL